MGYSRGVSQGSTAGRLLVATPPLVDPNFDRTVVYVIEHNHLGALGLVINRPTAEVTPAELGDWDEFVSPPATLFGGGPVQPEAIIGLAETDGGVRTVDLAAAPAGVRRVRMFRGYSGWSPGQLDAELLAAAWIVCAADTGDLFLSEPQEIWRAVLRRQGGTTAWLASTPDDLSMN